MPENNRDKLIRTAARRFMRTGFHGTSLDELLEESGVAKSNFYYHFQGKDDLADAVVEYWTDAYETSLVQPALGDEARDVWERLAELYSRAAATQSGDDGLIGCPLGRISAELAAEMPGVQQKLDRYFAALHERIAGLLREDHAFRRMDRDADAVAGILVATLEGGLLLSGLRRRPDDVAHAGRALVDLIRRSAT